MLPKEIPIHSLELSRMNTRKDLDAGQEDSGIDDLAQSIKEKGLLNPLTVRPIEGSSKYEVVAGQRRYLACRKIGIESIPCLIRDDLDDTDAVTISLVENVHRADMSPLDKARSLNSLYEKYNSYEKVAKETSWSMQTIKKYILLLGLPPSIRDKLSTKEGSSGVGALARLASTFKDEEEATEVYEKISGFKGRVQEEILKKSGGDYSKIDDLVEEAVEGVFDRRSCGGAFKCEVIKEIIEGEITQSEFQELVKEVAENLSTEIAKSKLKDASKAFWKTLSKG